MATPGPSIPQAASLAWRDTTAVFRALTAQVWIVLPISVVIAFVQRLSPQSEAPFATGPLLLGFVVGCVQAFLLTPYLIAVHRFIILGETATPYRLEPRAHRFQLFFLWSVVLSMFYWVPAFALGALPRTTGTMLVGSLLLLAIFVAAVIVSTRLIILFPAIAVDAPGATWGNAMADTKGHFWRILLISMLATLPVLVGMIAVALLAGEALWVVAAPLEGAMSVVLMTLAVAVASRLYEQLGDRVKQPD